MRIPLVRTLMITVAFASIALQDYAPKRLLYPINNSPRISDSIRDCCHGRRTVPWNCVQLTRR